MATAQSVPDALVRLCYAGESVVDAVRVGGATVAVTSHRVLAFAPDGDGPTLQEAALPNVATVEAAHIGRAAQGWRAVRYGIYGAILLGASTVVNFGNIANAPAPSGAAAGQVVGMAIALTGMLGLVDDALRIGGLAVLGVAALFGILYWYSRDPHLRVAVEGGEPLRVPAAGDVSTAADRLLVALEKASNPSDG